MCLMRVKRQSILLAAAARCHSGTRFSTLYSSSVLRRRLDRRRRRRRSRRRSLSLVLLSFSPSTRRPFSPAPRGGAQFRFVARARAARRKCGFLSATAAASKRIATATVAGAESSRGTDRTTHVQISCD